MNGFQAGNSRPNRQLSVVDEIRAILKRGANETWRLGLTEAQLDQSGQYAEMLVEWNRIRINLTRLVSPRDIAVKHSLDSLALLTVCTLPSGARVIDVGTGARLPGLALKIVRPDLRVILLDSTAKKLLFCRAVAEELGLSEVETVHARAGAPLETLLPWLAPFAAPHGRIAALKGASVAEEIAATRPALKRLNLALNSFAVLLPEAGEETVRQIVLAQRSPK